MSKAFEAWTKARIERCNAEAWYELIDKQSNATARHRGELHSAYGEMCIHFQPSDGATNYHKASPEFCAYLSKVMMDRHKELIVAVLDTMREVERLKLIACEVEVTAMQESIAKAKEQP